MTEALRRLPEEKIEPEVERERAHSQLLMRTFLRVLTLSESSRCSHRLRNPVHTPFRRGFPFSIMFESLLCPQDLVLRFVRTSIVVK